MKSESLIEREAQLQIQKNNSTTVPVLGLAFSFIFPPSGWIVFFVCLSSPMDSPRYKMAVRAQYLGSVLTFVYTLVIAMCLAEFVFPSSFEKMADGSPGIGF